MIKALRDRVIVKRFKEEDKIGSLYIPENAQIKPQVGEVVSVGEGHFREDLKPGDMIFFEGAVDKFKVEDEWFHVLKYEHIAAYMEKGAKIEVTNAVKL